MTEPSQPPASVPVTAIADTLAGDPLRALCVQLLPIWARQLQRSRSLADEAVADMLGAFSALRPLLEQNASGTGPQSGPASGSAADQTAHIAHQVEQMYLGLQFQDRVNQILALIQEDVNRLATVLQAAVADEAALEPGPWLARLASAYAMAEQHEDHGTPLEPGLNQGPDSEVSFF